VQPLRVVEDEVARQPPTRFLYRLVGMKINFLVFHRLPQTLDKNIVEHPAAISPALDQKPSDRTLYPEESRVPGQDRGQKHKIMRQADVSDIRRPDLVRTANLKMAKKIRVDPIQRLRLTRMAFRIDRRDPHDPPQAFDSLMIDLIPFPFQDLRHPRRSVKRRLHVLLVD